MEEKNFEKQLEYKFLLVEWLKRLQDHIERQERDIQTIKLKLQIA